MAGDSAGSASGPRFVGRARELTDLRAALAAGSALVLLEGEAGVGKTRLLRELVGGRAALVANCPPFRQPQTLGPVIDAVRNATDRVADLGLSGLGGVLRPLLPEWAAQLPAMPDPAEDPTSSRHRVFRALAELLDRLEAGLLVVEDAHWADDATLEFLLFLGSSQTGDLSLIVTYRPEDVPAGSLLRRLSSRRSWLGRETRVVLAPLTEGETADLMTSMLSGHPVTAEFARFMHERTDGVPLAVEETMHLMVDRDDVVRRAGSFIRRRLGEITVPATIRDAVLERLEHLSVHAQEVLRAVAVLAAPARADVVITVTGLDQESAAAGLAEGLDSGMIREDTWGLITFRHMLPGQAVLEDIPASTRREMHQRAGDALKGLDQPPAAQLVRHFRNAGDADQWAQYAEEAADLASAVGDQAAADLLLRDAIVHTRQPAMTLVRLTNKLSFAEFPGQDALRQLAGALRAALGTETLRQPEEGALRFQVGRILAISDDKAAARAEFEIAAHCLPPDSAEAAMAMIRLGSPQASRAPVAEHLRWLRRAALVPAPADPVLRLRLLVDRVTALLSLGEESGWAEAARLPRDATSGRTGFQVVRGALNVADKAIRWGRYDEAARRLETGTHVAQEHGYERVHGAILMARAYLDWLTGAWEGLSGRVTQLAAREDLQPVVRSEAALILGMLHASRGEMSHAHDCLTRALEHTRQSGTFEFAVQPAAALARLSLAASDPVRALEYTREPMDIIAGKGVWVWAADVAPVHVTALTMTGKADEAERLVAQMTRGLRGLHAPVPRVALLTCRAILVQARGEHARAAAAFGRSAAAWDAIPRPYDALLTLERQAQCLLARDDGDAALAVATRAAGRLARLGASADADRVIRELREHGVAARRPGSGRPSHSGPLSPRELEVVRLLATGRTDKEIAQTLVLSPKTIATHLESARRKLKVATRTGLVVAVIEAGLIDKG